jgi:hypothetical protein
MILCTNVYGPQMLEEKRRMLLDLEDLKTHSNNLHSILAGDFNIITSLAEKRGGTRRLDRDVEELSTFIDIAEMVDIRTNNKNFTWNNKWTNQHQVVTRLDRFLVSKSIIVQGLTLDCNILPWGVLITGQSNWKQTSQPPRRIDLSYLRNYGLNTVVGGKSLLWTSTKGFIMHAEMT